MIRFQGRTTSLSGLSKGIKWVKARVLGLVELVI
jgi:hypothetical protein